MKQFPKLSAISTIAISAIILLSAHIYVEIQKSKIQPARIFPEKKVASQEISPEMEKSLAVIFGKSLEEDKQAFESIIHQLLSLSPNDTRGGLGTRSAIDMKAREKYFLPDALSKYHIFVQQQKASIGSLGVDSGAPYTCSGNFNYGSQKYELDKKGNTLFTAEGYFSCGAWDAFSGYGKFKISVLTADNVTKPNNLKISDWNVEILESIARKKNFSFIEIGSKKYTIQHLSYEKYLEVTNLLSVALRNKNKKEALKDCSFIIDVPVGTENGNHSYGGYCRVESDNKILKVLICHDIMLGRLEDKNYELDWRINTVNEVAKFTVENCYGG